MAYSKAIREEELKGRLRKDYFSEYDAEAILGNIDFAVAVPVKGPRLFETEYLLWAEAKRSTHEDIYESFVQLIITIGKERPFDTYLPPAFLGAFDAEKFAFISYSSVIDVFYQNDFNWNVRPSDHQTKEFLQLFGMVKETLEKDSLIFYFDRDEKELHRFIRANFKLGKAEVSKIRINKNNFTTIYYKWREEVMPTIGDINWEFAKKKGIIDADFYLADILSEHNVTFKEKLYVLLRDKKYLLNRGVDETGITNYGEIGFRDGQKAHQKFWNRYDRPPKREYWDHIVERRDLLVPQDIRERRGSFFTPRQWVELSQQYIADELGENWQEEYYVWDCCAGTGNLLAGLTNKYNIWASTLDEADVDVMHDRIKNGANLLHTHVFQFDFLNDPFTKLPQQLQDIINDEEKRKKLVIYINPPYAEAASKQTVVGSGKNKKDVAVTHLTYSKYVKEIGIAARELFAQFVIRIYEEISGSILAQFSKLKIVQAPNFREMRSVFKAKLGRSFIVPAETFDNVKGKFPIGFFIWHLDISEKINGTTVDIYNTSGEFIGKKRIYTEDNDSCTINDWIISTRNRSNEKEIGFMSAKGNDFQNTNYIFIINSKTQLPHPRGTIITDKNIKEICIYFAVRHCIEATWLNDRDQFLFPNDGWINDVEFQDDCIAFTLFTNNIQSKFGTNHWIPFTEEEVGAQDRFDSHFMSDYIRGLWQEQPKEGTETRWDEEETPKAEALHFSPEAQAVMDAGRELWKYYHSQPGANPNASYYDIRLHFQGTKVTPKGKVQMNPDSADARYTELITTLRERLRTLAKKIEPKVYEYGFLKY